jgi:hypothetical protein
MLALRLAGLEKNVGPGLVTFVEAHCRRADASASTTEWTKCPQRSVFLNCGGSKHSSQSANTHWKNVKFPCAAIFLQFICKVISSEEEIAGSGSYL